MSNESFSIVGYNVHKALIPVGMQPGRLTSCPDTTYSKTSARRRRTNTFKRSSRAQEPYECSVERRGYRYMILKWTTGLIFRTPSPSLFSDRRRRWSSIKRTRLLIARCAGAESGPPDLTVQQRNTLEFLRDRFFVTCVSITARYSGPSSMELL